MIRNNKIIIACYALLLFGITSIPVYSQGIYDSCSEIFAQPTTEQALIVADEKIKQNGKDYKLYDIRGLIKMKSGNLYGALADFTHALDIKPDYIEAYKNRGVVKTFIGDYEGAIQDLNKAISVAPDGDIYYSRGYSKLAMQNYSEAIKDFSKSIEYQKDNAMAYHQRGYACCLLGKSTQTQSYFETALYDFDKSIELNPTNIESYLYRGMAKAELRGANAGREDIEYAMTAYKIIDDNDGYQRAKEIYSWIMEEY